MTKVSNVTSLSLQGLITKYCSKFSGNAKLSSVQLDRLSVSLSLDWFCVFTLCLLDCVLVFVLSFETETLSGFFNDIPASLSTPVRYRLLVNHNK